MRKYIINICLTCCVILFVSCGKPAKAAKFAPNDLADFTPAVLELFETVLSTSNKTFDNSTKIKLARQLDNNIPLFNLLSTNKKSIETWEVLSNSSYSKDARIIQYFDALPSERFSLKSNNGLAEVWNSRNEKLAEISENSINIFNLKENSFLRLSKLAPNTVYKFNTVNHHIDDLGRLSNIKIPLLKLNRSTINSTENYGQILSYKFGGLNYDINKTFISDDTFKEINLVWESALINRKKISEVNIIPIYDADSKIPTAFNIRYYEGKNPIVKHIPNGLKNEHDEIFKRIKTPAQGNHIDGRDARMNFPSNITLQRDRLMYKGNEFGTIDINNKTIHIDRRAALEGNINPFLAHPKLLENFTYVVKDGKNRHIYRTDNLGRVSESEHYVKESFSGNRNVVEQNKAKLFGDEQSSKTSLEGLTNNEHGKLSDEGGHRLADSAGGIPESINITSQAYKVNHSKKWRDMESKIQAAAKNGDELIVKTSQLFNDGTRRSSGSMYEIIINGKAEKFDFDNVNHTIEVLQK